MVCTKVKPEGGEVLGHDLMSPHIILKDMSITQALSSEDGQPLKHGKKPTPLQNAGGGFNDYVRTLLAEAEQESSGGLLSPSAVAPDGSRQGQDGTERMTMAQMIEIAISSQRATASQKKSATTFQIQRGGDKVAKVTLNRSCFRLGETVTGSVDFEGSELACYAVNAYLESAETVDTTIALRSVASIHRVTRRTHAQSSHDTTWAHKITFGLAIPPTATPDFVTTGVSLEWKVRLEFVAGDARRATRDEELLEEYDADDRGVVLWAVPELACFAFDVPISIRVYGSATVQTDAAATVSHII